MDRVIYNGVDFSHFPSSILSVARNINIAYGEKASAEFLFDSMLNGAMEEFQ